MQVITETAELSAFCARHADHDFVTVDTEFMREKTYFPKLCLIQVGSKDDAAIIDPLAPGLDLAPLLELLANERVLKVFHAARQDIEIFYALMDRVPAPLFDTQVAAMACGHGDQVGYEALVRETTGARVDKGSRFTDWAKRPLSDKQLTYALGDVTHLVHVYEKLVAQLDSTGRFEWVEEEMNALLNEELYFVAPERAADRIKVRNLRSKERAVLREVAAWREREAQTRDVPRTRIMRDDGLVEIARAAPQSTQELAALRSVPSGFERSKSGQALLAAVEEGRNAKTEASPQTEKSDARQQAPADVLDLLRVLLKRQCEEYGVAPKLLCTAAELEAIALSDNAEVPALTGWRRDVFGDLAVQLKRGEIALSLSGTRVKLIETTADLA